MILLLDTDVLIDLALDRRPHAEATAELLDLVESRRAIGFVAWHSLSNFHYLVRPEKGGPAAKAFLRRLCRFVAVAPTSTEHFEKACELTVSDFEDAMQIGAALAAGADYIVTRNVRDFVRSPIPATSPREVIARIANVE